MPPTDIVFSLKVSRRRCRFNRLAIQMASLESAVFEGRGVRIFRDNQTVSLSPSQIV